MPANPDYRFSGFREPRYTPIPDEFFDEVAPNLTEAELRVALYVLRRTFGFKKHSDAISLSQMSDGIVTRDGRVLDRGTGMARSAVWRGAKGLVEKGLLIVSKSVSPDGDNETNVYRLHFAEEGVVLQENHGHSAKELGVTLQENPQETVVQQTEKQETDDSNIRQEPRYYDKDRDALQRIVSDFARELGDTAPLPSTLSRTVNLYRSSGRDLGDFIEMLYAARSKTQEYSANVKNTAAGRGFGSKNKIPYFFGVVEDLLKA